MTKVKKLLKKAFTLVELVVVVAIIAILSGVSVAAYVGITDRANKAADQDVVAQLNLQLKAEEAVNGKNSTCFDAIKDCYSTGLNLEELRPSTKNSQFVWDQDNDRFAIINKDLEVVAEDSTLNLTSNQNHRWVLSTTYQVNANKNPVYLLYGCPDKELVITTGVDTGINDGISSIKLGTPDFTPAADLVVRTNIVECVFRVNASEALYSSTNIHHYGICGQITSVQTTTSNKYVEHGKVGMIKAKTSNIEIARGAKVYSCNYTVQSVTPHVEVDPLAEVYNSMGNLDKNFAKRFNSLNGEERSANNDHNNHKEVETVIDAKSAYQFCKGCGKTMINVKADSNKTFLKGSLGKIVTVGSNTTTSLQRTPIYVCDLQEGSSNGWSFNDYYYKNSDVSTIGGLKYQPGVLTQEQRYCSHENIKYTVDSTDSAHFHIGTCEECGFSFKDIHTNGNQCQFCDKTLHNWDFAQHKCTEHDGESFYKSITDTYNNVIEIFYCNGNVKIKGFNDSELRHLEYANRITLKDLLSNAIGSSFDINHFDRLSVEFIDAKYIPADFVFEMNTLVNEVIFPNTLLKIGMSSFPLTSIKNLILPSNLIDIGRFSFQMSNNLSTLTIPGSLETITIQSFYSCENLSYVSMAEGVRAIQSQSFESCKILERVDLPSTITSIDADTTFRECERLEVINFASTKAKFKTAVNNKWIVGPTNLTVQCTDGNLTAADF